MRQHFLAFSILYALTQNLFAERIKYSECTEKLRQKSLHYKAGYCVAIASWLGTPFCPELGRNASDYIDAAKIIEAAYVVKEMESARLEKMNKIYAELKWNQIRWMPDIPSALERGFLEDELSDYKAFFRLNNYHRRSRYYTNWFTTQGFAHLLFVANESGVFCERTKDETLKLSHWMKTFNSEVSSEFIRGIILWRPIIFNLVRNRHQDIGIDGKTFLDYDLDKKLEDISEGRIREISDRIQREKYGYKEREAEVEQIDDILPRWN